MGGVLMLVASILEFIIGNTFTFVAFGTYGRFPSLQWRTCASNQNTMLLILLIRWLVDCPGNYFNPLLQCSSGIWSLQPCKPWILWLVRYVIWTLCNKICDNTDCLSTLKCEAFALVFMGLPTFIFFICSLRTNIVYVLLFACLTGGFGLLAGTYWQLAQLNTAVAHRLQVVCFKCLHFPSRTKATNQ